ncbi:Lsr2 family protein [Pseudonocardia sp. EC080619-01]|uniref:histone-like nucleoid-structuring protein Lsr2 n=1 Tax=Pseudonocardia sp. EC080619-01 TaxID=1096856 RepID=UPI0009E7B9BC|nr:Lsr2 family protein [Pseudonocardia sp. EC080619-01]
MAQIRTVRLVDDMTGGEADETVVFGLDGAVLEIELSSGNARALREALAPFVVAARRAGARRTGRRAQSGGSRARASAGGVEIREHNRAVRAWARDSGFKVSARGRLSAEIVAAYEARAAEPETKATAARSRPRKSGLRNEPSSAAQSGTPSSVQFSG